MVAALHQVVLGPGHVVAQEVEAELVVGPVGDVGRVRRLAHVGGLLGQDDADLEPEEPVHPAHPLAVPLGQVVVGGDQVHALALEGVEIGRQGGHQGLALAGLHLGDVAQVQRGAAHQLDVEMPLSERPLGRLPHHGERLDQQVVGGFTVLDALLEGCGLAAQLVVGHRDVVVFNRVDMARDGAQTFECLCLADAEQSAKNHVFHPRLDRASPWKRREHQDVENRQPPAPSRIPLFAAVDRTRVGSGRNHGRRTGSETGLRSRRPGRSTRRATRPDPPAGARSQVSRSNP